MLMYGNAMNSILCKDYVFNITSLREGIPRLYALSPPNMIGQFDSYEFDQAYANYIMMNDQAFFELLLIVRLLNMGKDVYLVISEEDWSISLIQSLLKFIQQRYGFNGYAINSEEDLIYANNQPAARIDPTYGVANLDQDLDRYTYLYQEYAKRNMDPEYLLKYEDRESMYQSIYNG